MDWFIATTIYFLVLGFALLYNRRIGVMNEEYDKSMDQWYQGELKNKKEE